MSHVTRTPLSRSKGQMCGGASRTACCLTGLFSRDYSRLCRDPRRSLAGLLKNLSELPTRDFYRPDALPVNENPAYTWITVISRGAVCAHATCAQMLIRQVTNRNRQAVESRAYIGVSLSATAVKRPDKITHDLSGRDARCRTSGLAACSFYLSTCYN